MTPNGARSGACLPKATRKCPQDRSQAKRNHMDKPLPILTAILLGSALWASPLRANDADDLLAAFNEALKLQQMGKVKEAIPLYEKALRLAREVYGENHESSAAILNNLANLYQAQGRYAEAE